MHHKSQQKVLARKNEVFFLISICFGNSLHHSFRFCIGIIQQCCFIVGRELVFCLFRHLGKILQELPLLCVA